MKYKNNSLQDHKYTDIKNNNNKLIKNSFMIIFLGYIAYNLPSLIHTICEKDKIQKNTEYSSEEIHNILHLMTYDQNARVLLGTSENDIDMRHLYGMKNSTYSVLENLLLATKKPYNTIKIRAGTTNWTSYNLKGEVIMHTTKIICKHSHTTIQGIAQNLGISQEETYSLISALLNLSLGEYVEKGQSQDLFVEVMTKSGYNQNDLNANITGMLQGLAMHTNTAYHLNPKRFSEIIIKLQEQYDVGDATYYLAEIQKEYDIEISTQQVVTKK